MKSLLRPLSPFAALALCLSTAACVVGTAEDKTMLDDYEVTAEDLDELGAPGDALTPEEPDGDGPVDTPIEAPPAQQDKKGGNGRDCHAKNHAEARSCRQNCTANGGKYSCIATCGWIFKYCCTVHCSVAYVLPTD